MNDIEKELLEQYDLKVYKVKKGRGAFLCETNQGLKLVREYEGAMWHLEIEQEILSYLREVEGMYVDSYIKNKDGELCSIGYIGEGSKYYKEPSNYVVKDWYHGRECNLEEKEDIYLAVSLLAKLHKHLRCKSFVQHKSKVIEKNVSLLYEFEKHNRELKRTKNYIRDKKKKNEFERCVLTTYSNMYEQAIRATEILKQSSYENMLSNVEETGCFCHGSYNQHNILMLEEGIAVTNFCKCVMQVQVYDLYQFMRKVLEKNRWEEQLGNEMLEQYNKVLSISDEEYKVLYALFCYPEKYWKQINYYYNNNKCWIPQRNMEKLVKATSQDEEKNRFLATIFQST